jgi:hypothetical protein
MHPILLSGWQDRLRLGRTGKEDKAGAKLERVVENGMKLSEDDDEDDGGGRDKWGASKGCFRHLREVGVRGFVGAVEGHRGPWSTFTTPR